MSKDELKIDMIGGLYSDLHAKIEGEFIVLKTYLTGCEEARSRIKNCERLLIETRRKIALIINA